MEQKWQIAVHEEEKLYWWIDIAHNSVLFDAVAQHGGSEGWIFPTLEEAHLQPCLEDYNNREGWTVLEIIP